jgi:hypothetical protein
MKQLSSGSVVLQVPQEQPVAASPQLGQTAPG